MNPIYLKRIAIAVLLFAPAAYCAAQSPGNKTIAGIWQLAVPSSNTESENAFATLWKVYYPNGQFAVMECNANTGSSTLTYTGTYRVENDTTVIETVAKSKTLNPGTVNHISIHFISENLINSRHHIDSPNRSWQEMWKRVTFSDSASSDMAYINTPQSNNLPSRDVNGVYFYADTMPQYAKGTARNLLAYIAKAIVYPESALNDKLQGTSMIRFVVGENGEPENFQVMRSSYPALDEEAIRVIKTVKFTPGKQGGKKVKVYVTIPVTFKLK